MSTSSQAKPRQNFSQAAAPNPCAAQGKKPLQRRGGASARCR